MQEKTARPFYTLKIGTLPVCYIQISSFICYLCHALTYYEVQESEWLRVTLHKWLDDEYCPEATNVKISEIASYSFYKSLMEKRTDIGEILLEMARELESISYQESFHGAFSSANAAINLIIQRMQQD